MVNQGQRPLFSTAAVQWAGLTGHPLDIRLALFRNLPLLPQLRPTLLWIASAAR